MKMDLWVRKEIVVYGSAKYTVLSGTFSKTHCIVHAYFMRDPLRQSHVLTFCHCSDCRECPIHSSVPGVSGQQTVLRRYAVCSVHGNLFCCCL